ncbi:CAAX protease self-immunity [Cyclobacterium lianum]|uniref:CAAX protease self-immunity n=1 Tax=Cyclobacterium lianum TaxID=388280 RepID=A0A1M7LN93_9BACT|nr:CPBP family intramembrane glutamic endopeptidase [Cyclobacterium lianum]SHM79711.1 CAAX protease self-immunity [Cyclobacterium lianum]
MNRAKTLRNLIIFGLIALSIGWIGVAVDRNLPDQEGEESLGMAIWLVTPLLVVAILRSFGGDSWKDAGLKPNIKNNFKWYAVALLIFPLVTSIALIVGKLTGWTDFSGFEPKEYFTVLFGLFLVNIIKNIFEESVWRGYLTVKLIHLRIGDLTIYLVAGLIWGLWHVPYYLYFLDEETIRAVLPVDRYIFTVAAILSMLVWTVMFTEVFRLTQSIWPVILLHAMEDALINHLVIDGHIQTDLNKAIWISPICGIIPTALYLLIGIWLRQQRMKQTTSQL